MSDQGDLPENADSFEYRCPRCGTVSEEFAERCPKCGGNLTETFSGTFRPRRSPAVRLLVLAVLVLFLVALAVVFVISLRSILRSP